MESSVVGHRYRGSRPQAPVSAVVAADRASLATDPRTDHRSVPPRASATAHGVPRPALARAAAPPLLGGRRDSEPGRAHGRSDVYHGHEKIPREVGFVRPAGGSPSWVRERTVALPRPGPRRRRLGDQATRQPAPRFGLPLSTPRECRQFRSTDQMLYGSHRVAAPRAGATPSPRAAARAQHVQPRCPRSRGALAPLDGAARCSRTAPSCGQ